MSQTNLLAFGLAATDDVIQCDHHLQNILVLTDHLM